MKKFTKIFTPFLVLLCLCCILPFAGCGDSNIVESYEISTNKITINLKHFANEKMYCYVNVFNYNFIEYNYNTNDLESLLSDEQFVKDITYLSAYDAEVSSNRTIELSVYSDFFDKNNSYCIEYLLFYKKETVTPENFNLSDYVGCIKF